MRCSFNLKSLVLLIFLHSFAYNSKPNAEDDWIKHSILSAEHGVNHEGKDWFDQCDFKSPNRIDSVKILDWCDRSFRSLSFPEQALIANSNVLNTMVDVVNLMVPCRVLVMTWN